MNTQYCDVIVVGGGPAGTSAATILCRNKWKVIVVDSSIDAGYLGGQGNISYFPGMIESITGGELLKKLRKQAELVGAQFKSGRIEKIFPEGERRKAVVSGGETIEAKAVVLATGSAARGSYLHGEKEFLGRGVSHDAMTDGPIFAHRRVAVVGKNKHAAEEALKVARFASHVVFIIPSSKLDAPEDVQRELRHEKKIEQFLSTSLKKINGTDHVSSITIFTGGQEKEIELNGVFPYVHEYHSTSDFLKGTIDLSENGAAKIDGEFRSSLKGVFACGDIICAQPQLPMISCAQGILAGLSVDKYLVGK